MDYELRTTVHPKLLTRQQIILLANNLQQLGVNNYKIQKFRSNGCPNKVLCQQNYMKYLNNNYLNPKLLKTLDKKFPVFNVA